MARIGSPATIGALCCALLLLASRADAWRRVTARDGAPPRELLEAPELRPDETFARGEGIPWPAGPALASAGRTRFGATVQRLRGCRPRGDALVTSERDEREGMGWVVVHRGGTRCFRLPFPDAAGGAGSLRLQAAVDATGRAGPLVIEHRRPMRTEEIGGAREHHDETHLVVVSWTGALLLDRALDVRSFLSGDDGEVVELVPAIWDGDTLLAWASVRSWSGHARQCVGSLLALPRAGPVSVYEGVPCTLAGTLDVDGDGRVELHGVTRPEEHAGASWQAMVTRGGDFAAVFADPARGQAQRVLVPGEGPALLWGPGEPRPADRARLVRWPWTGEAVELDADLGLRAAFDWDGDGAPELLQAVAGGTAVRAASGRRLAHLPGEPLGGRTDGPRRELLLRDEPCGVAAIGTDGARRCGPGDVGGIGAIHAASDDFDWTGDGAPDAAFAGIDRDGLLWLAGWAEGDLTFSWTVGSPAGLAPLHQAPRALSLTGRGGPEVLQRAKGGFVVRAVPGGEVRWEGHAEDGVVDAWAAPVAGGSAVGAR